VRRLALALLALASSAASAAEPPLPEGLPPFGPDRPFPEPSVERFTTPEGLTVWLVARGGVPRFALSLAVRGGMASDRRGLEGVSELLAEGLKAGTASRSARQIAEDLAAVGGELAVEAGDDALTLAVSGLSSGLATALEVVADVARRSAFPEQEVALARANALEGLKVRAATPEFLAQKALAATLFGDHPYRIAAPTEQALREATPEDLRREAARRLRPEGALLVVVGSFDARTARRDILRAFGGWKGSGEAPPPVPDVAGGGRRRLVLVDRPGSQQSLLLLGRIGPRQSDPDWHAVLVANSMLGGGGASRLYQNVREAKGYSYSPRSSLVPHRAAGVLQVRADVRNDVTGAALLELLYELDRLGATAPPAEELARTKRFQIGAFVRRNQLNASLARTLAGYWVNGLGPEALSEFVPRVNAVGPAEVQRVGRRWYAASGQTVVAVGEPGQVRGQLEQFGNVESARP
jgi:predicted Zn-dependent peptidase